MRSATLASLATVAVVAASTIALVCLSVSVPEPPGRIVDTPQAPVDPAPSMFVASGGLVPDEAPTSEARDSAPTQAAVAGANWAQSNTH